MLVPALWMPACAPASHEPVAPPVAQSSPDTAAAPPPAASSARVQADMAPPPTLTDADACALPLSGTGKALPTAQPFTRAAGSCSADGDPMCDSVDSPPAGADACFVANKNIARAEREAGTGPRTAAASPAWDGTTPPRYLDRIDSHLHLTPGEHELLRKNGFVVLDRLAYASYANAFHDI